MIRAAGPAEAATLAAIHVAAWRETYDGTVPPDVFSRGTDLARRLAQWERTLAEAAGPVAAVFLAVLDGRPVGLGQCGPARDPVLGEGEVLALYVLREGRRRGLGRALMAAMMGRMAAAGLRSAGLWVLRENRPARAFYRALGGAEGARKAEGGIAEIAVLWRRLP